MKFKQKSLFLLPVLISLFSCTTIDENNKNKDFLIDGQFAKSVYRVGQAFEIGDFKVFDKDTKKEISYSLLLSNYTYKDIEIYDGYNFEFAGDFNVLIRKDHYNDYLVPNVLIQVDEEEKAKLVVDESKSDLNFYQDEYFNSNSIYVYDSLNKQRVSDLTFKINSQTVDDLYIFKEVGSFTLDVFKEGYEKTSTLISVSMQSSMNNLVVSNLPSTNEYTVGDKFNSSGLIIKDSFGNLVSNYTLSVLDGYEFKHDGDVTITVTKDGYYKTSFKVTVKNKLGLFIKNMPSKVSYLTGETFSLDGLKIYDNVTYLEVLDYSTSIDNWTTLSKIGTFNVEITKPGYLSTSFEINVVDRNSVENTQTLNIYSLNDTHGAFTRQNPQAGMAYIGDYLINAKKSGNAVILSAGDMWQGSVESNNTRGAIMNEAMNIIGFDAMTIGNHEFDWDEEAIINNQKRMEFPLLGANVYYAKDATKPYYLADYTTFEKNGVKVGVIGTIGEDLGSSIITSVSSKFTFTNTVIEVKSIAYDLKMNQGVDVVILATHDSGFEGTSGEPTKFSDLTTKQSFLNNESYVDAILLGHDHLAKQGKLNDVPFLEAGRNGEKIGRISLNLTKTGNEWNVTSSDYYVENAYNYASTANQSIANLLNIYSDEIGDTDEVIYTFKKSYSKTEFLYIVCDAMVWFVNANKSVFGQEVTSGIHNTAGIRTNVNAGDFTYKDLKQVCPFDNALCIMKLTSSQLSYLKRNSALGYREISSNPSSDGYYYAVTISYVAEWTNYGGSSVCTSYESFDNYIIADVVNEYLINKIDPNL